jgi:hypothetical protein
VAHVKGRGELHRGFWCGNHSEDVALDGRIVLNGSSRNRVDVAEDTNEYWAFVITVMNIRAP